MIVVSAQSAETAKIMALEAGADDYVTKPFELEVLHSRIHPLLRRAGNVQGRYLSIAKAGIYYAEKNFLFTIQKTTIKGKKCGRNG